MWPSVLEHSSQYEKYGLVLSIILTLIFLTLLVFKRKLEDGAPPGPRGLPFIGYLPFLGPELHKEFERLSKVYGPIYKLWLGNKLCVVVSSPELVKEVVRDQDIVFANRDLTVSTSVGSYGGNDIAFSAYGSEWKKLRKIFVREMLSNKTLDSLYGLRRQVVHNLLRKIYQTIESPIDIGSLAFETAYNAATNMLCSASLSSEKSVNTAMLREAVTDLMVLFGRPNVSDFFPIMARFDLQGIERETRRVLGVIDGILDLVIENRRKIMNRHDNSQEIIRGDVLHFLLELHDATSSISMIQFKALLQDILVGGTDTSTTMVEWTMAELLKHPEVMSIAQQELAQVVGPNNLVEESHLPQLTYLNAVIKETLRLHPALPLLVPRCPSMTATIGGYKVPKHTKVFINVMAIHRDPNMWDDPLEFKPERFLDNEGKPLFDYLGNNFHYMPFGSGRRIFPGVPLAERMTSHVVASLLHCFEWRLPMPLVELDMSDKFGIVVKKLEPLVAIPSPRLSNLLELLFT